MASIETTAENLAGALRLVAEILRQPALPESEVEQIRQENLTGIEYARSDPQYLAGDHGNVRQLNPYPREAISAVCSSVYRRNGSPI